MMFMLLDDFVFTVCSARVMVVWEVCWAKGCLLCCWFGELLAGDILC